MDLAATLARFDPTQPIHTARTPPAAWYTSDAVYQLERARVFGRTWQQVCRVDQVSQPGQHIAVEVAGEPWLIVRDTQGRLRAMSNVCRHKATPVAHGCGRSQQLVCPYHGWVYGLDGRLERAPRLGKRAGFDRAALSLPQLRVETWGPFVFVNADPEVPSLANQVGPLDAALEDSDWTSLQWAGRKVWDVGCNWKVFCDNYLDGGYHISHMHPSLDAQLDMSTYRTELFDRFSVQTSGGASVRDPRTAVDPTVRLANGALYAYLYPNFMLNRYGPVLDSNLVLPLGPDRCRVVFEFFFAPECDQAFIAQSLAQTDVTQEEDIRVSEWVQTGLGSRHFDRAPYAGVEVATHHFHRLLAADLQG